MINIFKSPIKTFIIYEVIFNILVYLVTLVISQFYTLSIYKVFGGFLVGSISITIGFIILVFSADTVLDKATNEKQAKNISLLFFICRYAIYITICGLAIKLYDINLLTMFLGLITIRLIIVIEHFRDRKLGGE